MKTTSMILSLTASLALTTSAMALATYDTDATSTFTLVDTGGMVISFETGPEVPFTTILGTATALIDADTQTPSGIFMLAPGESVVQTSEVSGTADAPFGGSSATVMNSVLVTLSNSSPSPAVAEFTFEYTWDASISKTDALAEAASASPFFHLSGFAPSGDETLMIDAGGGPMAVDEWLVNPAIGSPFGDPLLADAAMGTATVTAFVTVPAGNTDQFSVITDSFGTAIHLSTVPEPATLGLMALATLATATRRRSA